MSWGGRVSLEINGKLEQGASSWRWATHVTQIYKILNS